MALNSYLKVVGQTQGQIKGGVTQAGREDTWMIYGTNWGCSSPRDAASGMSTGKRQHKPFVVTKAVDQASPLTANVLFNNENITEWRLDYWRPSPSGQEEQYYTCELVNATVSEIRSEMLNNKYPENMQHELREHISFTYQKIIWTYQDGGITAEDDWETPVA